MGNFLYIFFKHGYTNINKPIHRYNWYVKGGFASYEHSLNGKTSFELRFLFCFVHVVVAVVVVVLLVCASILLVFSLLWPLLFHIGKKYFAITKSPWWDVVVVNGNVGIPVNIKVVCWYTFHCGMFKWYGPCTKGHVYMSLVSWDRIILPTTSTSLLGALERSINDLKWF